MSASLVRKGLELMKDDFRGSGKTNKKKKRKQLQTSSLTTTKSLKSARRHGATKRGRSRITAKDRRVHCVLDEFRKSQDKTSQLAANLRYFTKSCVSAQRADTAKIVKQHFGRQAREQPASVSKEVQKPTSVFSEEDFQRFQQEYFGRTVEEEEK